MRSCRTLSNAWIVALLLVGSSLGAQEPTPVPPLVPIPVDLPRAVITAPVGPIMAGDRVTLSWRGSNGEKPNWSWLPAKLPGKDQPRVNQERDLELPTYPGPVHVRLVIQTEAGSDITELDLWVMPYVAPFSPLPVTPPVPQPPEPPTLEQQVQAAFGTAGAADAARYAKVYAGVAAAIDTIKLPKDLLAATSAAMKAVNLTPGKYPALSQIVSSGLPKLSPDTPLDDAARGQIAVFLKSLADACAKAGKGASSSAR